MDNRKRYIVLYAVLIIFAIIAIIRLSVLQIVNGKENYEKSLSRTQRTVSISAPRGEIYDRYGRVIVGNRMGFSVEFQRVKGMDDAEINEIILKTHEVFKSNEETPSSDELPVTDKRPYAVTFSDEEGKAEASWKKEMNIPEDYTAAETVEHYALLFNVDKKYTDAETRLIVGVRYTMLIRGFSTNISYTLAGDVSKDTVVSIKEHYDEYRGVNIMTKPVREYPHGNLGAHILGRTGLISDIEYSELKTEGYGMNDYIGKEGLEKYLEKNLRGKNGRMVAEQDENGHYVALTEAVPAESGNSVYLTIDLDVQKAAEKALKETVAEIYSKHEERGYGADVAGGAAVAIDVETGEVICMASYPDYSIEDYNKNYSKLISDRNNPLFNRALSGTYSPGSTYKMLVGIAALEEKVILPDTLIKDEVIYKLGQGHFKCLHDHGFVNVSTAIKDSCNYFFYTAGYQLGIDKMVEYADKFGLGKSTGIELPEETGTVSSPETKALRDEPWYEGYTLQAAIGQDDNKFTPIQLASYVSQIASGGVRYTPHLVKGIYSYGGKEVISLTEIKESDRITLTQENLDAVRYGMRLVALSGTASLYFEDYPIKVAAKTGTAEVYGGSDNGLFVAYAPYENPKIAVAVVIERSGGGSYCGPVAKAIIDAYLNAENSPELTLGIDKLY
ncbi:MAG: penicillin-binding protein 2 [Clostridia bacterium]|nr:penicillin-binding protein 2 [Clostridia bacterium]